MTSVNNPWEASQFLGLASFYRKLVGKFPFSAHPFTNLTKKDAFPSQPLQTSVTNIIDISQYYDISKCIQEVDSKQCKNSNILGISSYQDILEHIEVDPTISPI